MVNCRSNYYCSNYCFFLSGARFFNKVDEEELSEKNVDIDITPQMVTSIERGDLKKTVSTSGYLQAADEKALTFSLNGEIEEVLISEG